MNVKTITKNAALVTGSLIFAAALIALAEAVVRLSTDVPSLGNSANLFRSNAFGTSIGNARNVEAISFGISVYTDADGFRVSKDEHGVGRQQRDSAILVLGDSVGFGSGVRYPETFAARLVGDNRNRSVYNTSVIGYGVEDYRNVTEKFASAHVDEISSVFLVFCLNDISYASRANISGYLDAGSMGKGVAEQEHDAPGEGAHGDGMVERLKQSRLFAWLNASLRSRSKLYVLVKGLITDPQARYWKADLQAYEQLTPQGLASVLAPLRETAAFFRERRIPFTVIVTPYEYQVRVDDESTRRPQQMLGTFFESEEIRYVDALPLFRKRSERPADLFLPYDPMHLSPRGHRVLYEIIAGILTEAASGTGEGSQ